jgi:hypothetical protein
LRKSISQAGIIKDERFDAAVEALKGEAGESSCSTPCGRRACFAPAVGKALRDPRQQGRWMVWDKPDDPVTRLSLVAAAARDTCLARKEELWKGDALLSILTQAPLLFDVRGQPAIRNCFLGMFFVQLRIAWARRQD